MVIFIGKVMAKAMGTYKLWLALGAAICLLIVLFIKSESSVDSWREDGDHVYRMVLDRIYPGRQTSYAFIPSSYAKTVKNEIPEVEEATRIFNFLNNGTFQISFEDKKFEETKVFFADPTFFNIFKSNLLYGSEEEALSKPNSIVLNETTAKKYFGDASLAIGKILEPGKTLITIMHQSLPENSLAWCFDKEVDIYAWSDL